MTRLCFLGTLLCCCWLQAGYRIDSGNPSCWSLDPSPAEQQHGFETGDGGVTYVTGASGRHGYSQLIRRDIMTPETAPRYGELTFRLAGDGTGGVMQVILFCADGSRWQHPVRLDGAEWRTERLSFERFELEPHGNQAPAATGARPDSREIRMVSFWFDTSLPHRVSIADLAFDGQWQEKAVPDRARVEFYPATTHRDDTTYLLPGRVTPMVVFLGELTEASGNVLELTLPEGMLPVGADFGSNTAAWPLPQAARNEGSRWLIPLPEAVCAPGAISKFQPALNLFVTAPADAEPGTASVDWRVDGASGLIASGTLKAVTLPALPELPLAEAAPRLYTYTTILFASPDAEIRRAMAETLEAAGISGGVIYPDDPAVSLELIARGWRLYRHAFNWWDNWGVWADDFDAPRMATRADGAPATMPGALCPEWLLGQSSPGQPYYELARAKLAPAVIPGMAGFLNDHEMLWNSDIAPDTSCFDPECIATFAAFAGLDAASLTPETILAQYRQPWYDFRYRQQGRLIGVYGDIVKSLDEDFAAAICSFVVTPGGYETPISLPSYDRFIDEHWPMCYKSGVSLHHEVENTVRGVTAPVTVLLNNLDPINERVYTPPDRFELNLISALTSGVRGVGVFTGDISLDGEYLTRINRALRLTRPLARWVPEGRRDDGRFNIAGVPDRVEHMRIFDREVEVNIPDWSPALRSRVFERDGSWLVLAYNYSDNGPGLASVAMIDAPQEMAVYDHRGNRPVLSPSGQSRWTPAELAAGIPVLFRAQDCVMLILSPESPSDPAADAVTPEDIRGEYRKRRAAVIPDSSGIVITAEPQRYPLTGEGTFEAGSVTVSADAEAMRFRFDLSDRDIVAGPTGHDAAVWSGDCVEIFLTDGGGSYYHFGVGASGGTYDAKDRDASWDGDWTAVTGSRDGGWFAEIVLPWPTIALRGRMKGNFARENFPDYELTSLAPTGGNFHDTERFVEFDFRQ